MNPLLGVQYICIGIGVIPIGLFFSLFVEVESKAYVIGFSIFIGIITILTGISMMKKPPNQVIEVHLK